MRNYVGIFYAAPAWYGVMGWEKYKDKLEAVARRANFRTAMAYRRVSREAVSVIAARIPLHLLIEDRVDAFEGRSGSREVTVGKW